MNDKQQRFAEEYLVDMNATQAAIRAGYSAHTAKQQGSRLLTKADVQAAIQTAQAEHREHTAVTIESLTEKLRAAYDQAASNGQAAAMVQAAMGLAKLHGLLVDKVEQTTKAADMTPAELEAELARVRAELEALEKPPTAH
jgi:hypothetical protein